MDNTERDPALSDLEQRVLDAARAIRYVGPVGAGRIEGEMLAGGDVSPGFDLVADACKGLAAAGYLQATGMASYPLYLAVK